MYLHFTFLQSAVTFHHQKCILFSPFLDLQSHFNPGNVSAFLLFAICGHLPAPESDVQSLVSNKKTQQKTIFSPDAAVFLDSKKDSGIRCNARYTLILPGFQHSPCCCHCCHHRCSNGSRKNTIFFVHHVLCCSRFVV